MNDLPLLSWLHISDLHIKDDHDSGRLEIAELLGDLSNRNTWYEDEFGDSYGPPEPQVIFITGDLAFSGNARGSGEYDGVAEYLNRLCSVLQVPKDRVFIVPGNHDIHRSSLDKKALEVLSKKPEDYDLQTERRLRNYNQFVEPFGDVNYFGTKDRSWFVTLENVDVPPVTVLGLNTALLSAAYLRTEDDDKDYLDDRGRLRLDDRVVAAIKERNILRNDGINIVLMHHPPAWLKKSLPIKHHTLIFHGHTHEPDVSRVEISTGTQVLTTIAGAIHLGDKGSGSIEQLGYNIGGIFSDDDGYRVEVWPRIFIEQKRGTQGAYYLDVVNVPPGRCYKSIRWQKKNVANPNNQHKLFWSSVLRSTKRNPTEITQIWIAAQSAWFTFRPKGGVAVWDKRLFEQPFRQLELDELEGHVWPPLLARIQSNENERFRISVLLAHPYGAEAKCVLRNQLIKEKHRHAERDFFRTLRSIQQIQTSYLVSAGVLEFRVRVLNPCYRLMTYSMYAVDDHVLFLPLDYTTLADSGVAVGHSPGSFYNRYLDHIKEYFQDRFIEDSGKLYYRAKEIDLQSLPESEVSLSTYMSTIETNNRFSWLRRTSTREEHELDIDKESTFHFTWMCKP